MNDERTCIDCTGPVDNDPTLDSHCRICQDAIDYASTLEALRTGLPTEVLAPFFAAHRVLKEIVRDWNDSDWPDVVEGHLIDTAETVLKQIK